MEIQKVRLNLAEGRIDDIRHNKWNEFEYGEDCNIFIQGIVFDYYQGVYKSPFGGGCYKTDYEVYFDNGEVWRGTMEVDEEDNNFITYLQNHILFNCGKKKPFHWSQQDYLNHFEFCKINTQEWQKFWDELENTQQFQIKVTK